ncbi:MAG: coenzyme F420-0:L-glutamate ligase [Candidatus Heimdallarchaeota archaeon]|nr:coenzyme F420-0:L-glutamate ligase [Candidatus Heimdallarchaeota archaeon]MCK4769005.1 coenzyme F420-0:L-glutamate ligase [Candidatus Heimdallarchaeota archaeon]
MFNVEIIPIRSVKIIEEEDDLLTVLGQSLENQKVSLKDDDILVIASKVISVAEGRIVSYDSVEYGELAEKLGIAAKISPEFAQLILNESGGNYIGAVPGAITTLNAYGLLANAGADQSNVGERQAILLPKDCKQSARKLHGFIHEKYGKYAGIIVADSRTMPLRLGTVGGALATFGFKAVLDVRGKKDLFGRPMHITTRAIADQLATAAELVMGETDERIPFVIIRGYSMSRINASEEKDLNTLITAEQCMFIGPLLKCLEEKRGS